MRISWEELQAENEMLRREIKVAREAADITSAFVVRQFEQTERMLNRFQVADSERQAVLDAATQLSIIATDLDGQIQMFSSGASTLLGFAASNMVGRKNIQSLHLADEIEKYGSDISGVAASSLSGMAVFGQYVKQKHTLAQEWLYKCQNGTLLPVNLSITGLWDSGGLMTGYLFTAMDLTIHKQLEFELREARDVAESANVSKGDFLARMSHEIRTPMNGIIGMAHLLKKTEKNKQQADYIEKLQGSANTLLRLINDILDFSKIDAGKLVLEAIPFNLEDVLGNVANVISLQAEKKRLEFLFHIDPQVPYNLDGDPLRLGQVLMNLAGNAVKFTEQGEVVIVVNVEESNEETVCLRFTVRDSGIGLQEEQIKSLFTPFSQADDSITRKYGGTGLGLAICKQLTEMMNGQIWAKSELGEGSDFIFTAWFGLTVESRLNVPASFEVFHGLRALVVDDNKAARKALISILTSLKMEVDNVSNGQAAIKLLEAAVQKGAPYDVVLLDWIMPGIDGIETARRIKENKLLSKVPAMLMVTANGREEAYEKAERVGMDGFLLKPVYGSVIYNTLLQIMGFETVSGRRIEKKESNGATELENIRGARILLVDDNPINRDVGIAFLEDVGMVVELAENGRESLDAIAERPFDLVFMDIQMPDMDGLEATRRIRMDERFKDLPVIAMTAHAMSGDRDKSLAAGMNEHITKPIDPVVLYRTLQEWIPEKTICTPAIQEKNVAAISVEKDVVFPYLPGIDHEEGLRRLNNNSRLLLELLEDFQSNFSFFPTILRELSGTGNWHEIKEKVHMVKGVASYVGALSLYELACELESALFDEKQDEAARKLLEFINALDEVLSSLTLLSFERKKPAESGKKVCDEERDFHAILEEIQKLINFLQSGELMAEEQFDLVKELIAGLGHDKQLLDIEEKIDNIEYEEAAVFAADLLPKLQQHKS